MARGHHNAWAPLVINRQGVDGGGRCGPVASGWWASAGRWDPPLMIGDRVFTGADPDLIRWTTDRFGHLSRWKLALTIRESLERKAPNGALRVQSSVALLAQLAVAGMARLPAKRGRLVPGSARRRAFPLGRRRSRCRWQRCARSGWSPCQRRNGPFWYATGATQHALGFQRAFGAHQRYWIYGEVDGRPEVLGAPLFAASARKVAARDAWLGWSTQQQQRFRYRVVANSRFLIRSGVRVPHLASHALALALRRLTGDWLVLARFGYEVVAVETFVAPPCLGTCYRAANWTLLGQTAGTGRQNRRYEQAGTPKQVFVYPLRPDFRQAVTDGGTYPRFPDGIDPRRGAKGGRRTACGALAGERRAR